MSAAGVDHTLAATHRFAHVSGITYVTRDPFDTVGQFVGRRGGAHEPAHLMAAIEQLPAQMLPEESASPSYENSCHGLDRGCCGPCRVLRGGRLRKTFTHLTVNFQAKP